MISYSIHPDTNLGPVHLTTADLQRAIGFYVDVIGLQLTRRKKTRAWLGAEMADPLLILTEQPDAKPKPPRTTGLYHFAILLPTRLDLARSLRHLADMAYPLQGASDHLVSEALYLSDPEGNGIEIYADRPRDVWRNRNGQLVIATVPLNVNDLLEELDQESELWNGLPAQTRIGHIHLHVTDLDQAEAFYHDVLGFDLISRYGPSAAFVSAGGYHHHIGMNTWAGAGAPPPPDVVGLRRFTIQLPDVATERALRDHLHRVEMPFVEESEGISLRDSASNEILLTV